MTLSKLKDLNKKNGGHFFDADAMKAFGDTMYSYNIQKLANGDFEVTRKTGTGRWRFSSVTGRVLNELP